MTGDESNWHRIGTSPNKILIRFYYQIPYHRQMQTIGAELRTISSDPTSTTTLIYPGTRINEIAGFCVGTVLGS